MLKVNNIMPDTQRFKPWSPMLVPAKDLIIEIEINKEEVVSDDENQMVITLDGLGQVFTEYSIAMEKHFEEFENRLTKEVEKYKA